MERRAFLRHGWALGGAAAWTCWRRWGSDGALQGPPTQAAEDASLDAAAARSRLVGAGPPAYSIIPVVGDGKWIWTKPPVEQTGYLEPRDFELSIGVEMQGTGAASGIQANTPVPVEFPEQKIEDVRVETQGCAATLRAATLEAAELVLAAPGIRAGQVIGAAAKYRLKLHKDYRAFTRDRFPAKQEFGRDFLLYLQDSPGIQTRDRVVRELATKVAGQIEHPWNKAEAFHAWVWENISPRPGRYTNVLTALRDLRGDCEERAAVFVALCRAAGVPARLVWVPNHNWAEFGLKDEQGALHWIPSHTSAYSYFGWTGVHELVIQKGDNIRTADERKPQRLLPDTASWIGARPNIRFFADLKPLPPTPTDDAGPGARSKDAKGEWVPMGKYAAEKFVRR